MGYYSIVQQQQSKQDHKASVEARREAQRGPENYSRCMALKEVVAEEGALAFPKILNFTSEIKSHLSCMHWYFFLNFELQSCVIKQMAV